MFLIYIYIKIFFCLLFFNTIIIVTSFQISIMVNDQFSTQLTFIASCLIYHTCIFYLNYHFNSLYCVHPMSYDMLVIMLSYLILSYNNNNNNN